MSAPAALDREQLEAREKQGPVRYFNEILGDSGTHRLGESGLQLVPRPGIAGSALELVPAPPERHWRLLNGGHVDIVPRVRQDEAARLARLSSVQTVELPTTSFVALVINERLAARELFEELDIDTIALTVCGESCRARYPIEPAPVSRGEDAAPKTLELMHLEGAAAEALGAHLIAHELLDENIEIEINAVDFETFNRKFVDGDFDLFLTLAPTSPEAFPQFLELMGIPEDQVASRLIPLWDLKIYAAYDTSICDVEPDSATSWSWLAKVRPCEAAP